MAPQGEEEEAQRAAADPRGWRRKRFDRGTARGKAQIGRNPGEQSGSMNRADDEVGAFDTHLILTTRRGGWCRWTVQVGSGSVADEEGMEPRRATHWGGVTGRSVDDAKGGEARRAAREQECATSIAVLCDRSIEVSKLLASEPRSAVASREPRRGRNTRSVRQAGLGEARGCHPTHRVEMRVGARSGVSAVDEDS